MIDVLHSGRGLWVAAIVFGAVRGSLAVWFLGWGLVLGWIPAATLVIPLGYVCRSAEPEPPAGLDFPR